MTGMGQHPHAAFGNRRELARPVRKRGRKLRVPHKELKSFEQSSDQHERPTTFPTTVCAIFWPTWRSLRPLSAPISDVRGSLAQSRELPFTMPHPAGSHASAVASHLPLNRRIPCAGGIPPESPAPELCLRPLDEPRTCCLWHGQSLKPNWAAGASGGGACREQDWPMLLADSAEFSAVGHAIRSSSFSASYARSSG